MTKKDILSLEGMHFFAYHGFYEAERIIGGEFEVDVSIEIHAEHAAEDDALERTVNYESIYQIVQEEMSVPRKLIETLAYSILHRLKVLSAEGEIRVKIRKLSPPLAGQVGASAFEVIERADYSEKLLSQKKH